MKNFRSIEGDALAQAVQRRLHLRAQRQLFHQLPELHADRVGGLGGDGLQAAVDVVAGAHGAGEQVDGIRQLLFELAAAGASARARCRATGAMPEAAADEQPQEQAGSSPSKAAAPRRPGERQQHAECRRRRRRGTEVGLFDVVLQAAQHPDPGDQVAQECEGAAMLPAHQFGGAFASASAHWRAVRAAGRQHPLGLLLGHRPDVVRRREQRHREDEEGDQEEHLEHPIEESDGAVRWHWEWRRGDDWRPARSKIE